jgi:hypothetical protein
LSPYWRPADYASAIVIADALVWEGADAGVLRGAGHIGEFGQYLVRALIFRLVSEWLFTDGEPSAGGADGDPWELAVKLACGLAAQ